MLPRLDAGMVPKMTACHQAVTNGVPARHRRRRTRAPRRTPRDLHRRGRRHPGAARRRDQAPQGTRCTGRRRHDLAGALRVVADEHLRHAQAAAHPRRGCARLGRRRSGVRRPARRHRRERPRPRPPGDRRGRHRPSSQTLGHVSNFFASEPQLALAERLLDLLGAPRPRLLLQLRRRGQRGRASSSPAAPAAPTSSPPRAPSTAARWARSRSPPRPPTANPFEPLPGNVTFVPYGDADALAAAVTDDTAAVVLEPIQGEAGVRVPPAGYLAAARQICDDHGALLWLDEVQTGIGRTGAWFAHQLPGARGQSRPTSSPWPRGSAAASRSARPSPRRGRRAARARQPRHHLRRQPGRLRGRARRPRHDREGPPPRPRQRARQDPARRAGRGRPRDRDPRRGPDDRPRAQHRRTGASSPRRWRRASSSTPPARPRSGSCPPLVLTDADAQAFIDAWPAILDASEVPA